MNDIVKIILVEKCRSDDKVFSGGRPMIMLQETFKKDY
jgi:hypothetical protein